VELFFITLSHIEIVNKIYDFIYFDIHLSKGVEYFSWIMIESDIKDLKISPHLCITHNRCTQKPKLKLVK